MDSFDILIVGAGPGGSNAASVALRAGLRVAQLDAARFPRVKPCAGGITKKGVQSLRLELGPTLRRSHTSIEFNVWGRRRNRFTHRETVLDLVCRPEFDNDLVRQNLALPGFEFVDGCRVRDVTYDDKFTVTTERGTFRAAQVIGADGAYSIVNRVFRIAKPARMATAVEVNIPMRSSDAASLVPCFDYGAVSDGYGWVFPKDDQLSVGLYTLSSKVPQVRTQLLAYLQSRGLGNGLSALPPLEAAKIPVGGFRLRTPAVPVYVVGDAGGFADALTGEGIYHALESGRLAGEVAVDVARGRRTHHEYYRRLWGSVLRDTAVSYFLALGFYRNVDRGIRFLQHSFIWRPLIEGATAGATFSDCLLKGAWYLPRSRAAGLHQCAWDQTPSRCC